MALACTGAPSLGPSTLDQGTCTAHCMSTSPSCLSRRRLRPARGVRWHACLEPARGRRRRAVHGPAPPLVRAMCCSTLGCGSRLLALDAAKDAERQQSRVRGTVTFIFFSLDLTQPLPTHPPCPQAGPPSTPAWRHTAAPLQCACRGVHGWKPERPEPE